MIDMKDQGGDRTMKRVLVIDDEQDILDLVAYNLSRSGFRCFTAQEAASGMDLLMTENPDLVILDIMLSGSDGLTLLKELKLNETTSGIPVIMLTAKAEESDRILGLEMGADDYISKPFSVRELILRVQRILERVELPGINHLVRCNGITLDFDKYEVTAGKNKVGLTSTEFKLLAFLLRNKGRVLSRTRLLEKVWGYSYIGTTRTVDTHIQRLRNKLHSVPHGIETIRGVGYKLEPVDIKSRRNEESSAVVKAGHWS